MSEEGRTPTRPRRWPRRFAACLIGVVTFWGTWLFVSSNLVFSTNMLRGVSHGGRVYEIPGTYRVEFFGMVLAKDDNPDGCDIDEPIDQTNIACLLVPVAVSVGNGRIVGYTMNAFWRLGRRPRRIESR